MALLLVLGVLLTAAPAFAQLGDARMSGTVTDAQDNPIEGVAVSAFNPGVSPSTYTAVTDERGRWAILGLKGNAMWKFSFELAGYITVQIDAQVPGSRRNPPMDVIMDLGNDNAGALSVGANVTQTLLPIGITTSLIGIPCFFALIFIVRRRSI